MAVALLARVFDTQANQSFEATFERFPVRVGRNQLNDLPIDRPYVSQFHAAFEIRNDSQLFVKDLGSTNGTLYKGQRLVRDQLIDITGAPEITIGPIVIRLGMTAAAPPKVVDDSGKDTGVLDFGQGPETTRALAHRYGPMPPGAEDPYVRQVAPYIEAYRQAWQTVYRVIYDHLTRLPPDVRNAYLRRLGYEQPALSLESDFRKIAQYYGIDLRVFTQAGPGQAALAALTELATTLAPGTKLPDDVPSVLGFAKRVRDSLDVFLRCFISLRDGYKEFSKEVLDREEAARDPVAASKDAKELGIALLGHAASPETPHALQNTFVEVMSHQVALMNGVMEGVKQLLQRLSPKSLEAEFERSGKKGGLFSNRFEALWKLYEVRHADYAGEDKETFLVIFGSQFSRAYAQAAGENFQQQGDAPKLGRFTQSGGRRGPGGQGGPE
ncbi:MAG: FHA domain-containing protein [Polyangiaceae bacterium]|jgi:type VI secretion system protein ImpI|nr:FHA domain-containing protein [Polyangiaceae bacterium]